LALEKLFDALGTKPRGGERLLDDALLELHLLALFSASAGIEQTTRGRERDRETGTVVALTGLRLRLDVVELSAIRCPI
jgi:hypothetical protein